MNDQENKKKGKFGIIVSGGPAPGINCVISSSVIEAYNNGYETVGFRDGFRAVCHNEANSLIPLTMTSISGIYNTGGSVLGTTRHNPFGNEAGKNNFIRTLKENNIDKLIIIGGEGSAYVSYKISKNIPDVKVVHVPKTIDNDLILPNKYPSFAVSTALF